MIPDAVLISQPAFDFNSFIGLSHKAVGFSPARHADSSGRKMSDSEKFLWCLTALQNQDERGAASHLLGHVSFSVFLCADDRDLTDIYDCASGMEFASANTLVSGVKVAVLSGSLMQWRTAVRNGATPAALPMVRACYSKILALFDKAGLGGFWSNFSRRPAADHTGLYLEDKR